MIEQIKNIYSLNLDYLREFLPIETQLNYKVNLITNSINSKRNNKKIVVDYQDNIESLLCYFIADILSPYCNNEVYLCGTTTKTKKYLKKRNKHFKKITWKEVNEKRDEVFVLSPFNPIIYVYSTKKSSNNLIADYYPLKDFSLNMCTRLLSDFFSITPSMQFKINKNLPYHMISENFETKYFQKVANYNCGNSDMSVNYDLLLINLDDVNEDNVRELIELINSKNYATIYFGHQKSKNLMLTLDYNIFCSAKAPHKFFNYGLDEDDIVNYYFNGLLHYEAIPQLHYFGSFEQEKKDKYIKLLEAIRNE